MKILSSGNVIVLLIAFTGVGLGIWSRRSTTASLESQKDRGLPVSFVSSAKGKDSDIHESNVFAKDANEPETTGEETDIAMKQEGVENSPRREFALASLEMLPGVAHPLQVAEIAAAADGPLWKLFVAEGDVVSLDTVMGLIDNRVALASVHAAQSTADRQAMLEAAKAKVSLADQYLNRIQHAASKNAASGLEVDEARSRLAEAQAALKEGLESQRDAVARLEIEKAKLDTHEIRAPFQGTVIRVYPHLGETVSRGAPIFKIADVTRLRADLYVPVSRAASIQVGQSVILKAELPEQPSLDARVVFVAPLIDAATQTVRVVVEIENANKQLPAGFAVRLSPSDRS